MVKVTGIDVLQRQLKEAERVLKTLDGELGTVHFDPHDPSSIEAAIQHVYTMVDQRAGEYASNPILGPVIEQMKEEYREKIIQNAAEIRLQESEDE